MCCVAHKVTLKAIPSQAVKKKVFVLMQVSAAHRQTAASSTGRSTPRERNLPGPSPILSAGFEEVGSTAENPGIASRRTAAGGRLRGSLL